MPTPAFAPPTAEQVALVTRVLASSEQPAGTLGYQELRGFLFGIATAPMLVRPSEWIPDVFGGKEPELHNLKEAESFMGALMACYNDAVSAADTDGAPIDPARVGIDVQSEESLGLWSQGFSFAYDCVHEAWEEILSLADDDDRQRLSLALTVLTTWADPAGFQRIQELDESELQEHLDSSRAVLPGALALIAGIGRGVYAARLASRRAAPRPPRPKPAAGRNAPCPCGSGKKYKHCCLVH